MISSEIDSKLVKSFLALSCALGIAACGDDNNPPVEEPPIIEVPDDQDDNQDDDKDEDKDEEPRPITLFEDNFEANNLDKWRTFDFGGNKNWVVESFRGNFFAVANCYQADADCDEWLVTPEFDLTQFTEAKINFESAWNYGEDALSQMKLKVSTDMVDDPTLATWIDISDQVVWSAGNFEFTPSGDVNLEAYLGEKVHLAFHYKHPASGSAKWEIDNVVVGGMGTGDFPLSVDISVPDQDFYAQRPLSLSATAANGQGEPYTFSWDFGDGQVATGASITHTYQSAGQYEVTLTVEDSAGDQVAKKAYLNVVDQGVFTVPAASGDLRVASFNIGFDPFEEPGLLKAEFEKGDYNKAKKVAEIIQRTKADVLLLNEIDGNDENAAFKAFNDNYLIVGQNGANAIVYEHIYASDCNTGVPSGVDLNNDGKSDTADDAFGFGSYPGKYCMVILSKYPLDMDNAKTFQNFLWKDMPGANVPEVDGQPFYSAEAWNIFRLSSKTHIDLPVVVDGKTIHVLASHPTPPVFDGPEDRNGKRNFDEIRLWSDYITPDLGTYLYDDQGNSGVSLAEGDRFIIMGDENASSVEGDAFTNPEGVKAIDQLLYSPMVNPNLREDSANFQVPISEGGAANTRNNVYATTHTAVWAMRADYVLPSSFGFAIEQSGVFWPKFSDDLYYLVESVGENDESSSDHRLVWMDLSLTEGSVTEPPADDDAVVYFSDDFTADELVKWNVIDKGDSAKGWEKGSFNDTHFAKASCFRGTEPCEDWIVTNIDLTAAVNPELSFRSATKYGDEPLSQISVLVSVDFDGDTAAATWVDLSESANWSDGNYNFVESGDLDLSAYVGGELTLAFRYTATPENAATWQIADVLVEKARVETPVEEVILEDKFEGEDLAGWTNTDLGEPNKNWRQSSRDGINYAEMNCYGGDATCNDWLLRTVDLSEYDAPKLSFSSAQNFGDNPLSQLRLLVSVDYSDNVETATWVDLSSAVSWSGGSYAWQDSGLIDLVDYAGQSITIAFHYQTTEGQGPALWRITNFKIINLSEAPAPKRGGTILSDVAPSVEMDSVNTRLYGDLVFAGIEAPTTEAEKHQVLATSSATLNGVAIPNFGYTRLAKSGETIGDGTFGLIKDSNGDDIFVSNYNEFSSLLPVEDRLFAISQFESIPGGMYLSEVSQDATTGALSFTSTRSIDFSGVKGGYNHCAASVTPWHTHLAAEEYEPDYAARQIDGSIDSYYDQIKDFHNLNLADINPYWYGYPVEVSVKLVDGQPESSVVKHYAAGRVSIEVPYVMPDRKTMYITDDGTNGGLYLFIADQPEDLSSGTLYAMKWNQTAPSQTDNAGMGAADIEWISLGHADNASIGALINGDNPISFSDMFSKVDPVANACPLGYRSINFKGDHECLLLKPGQAKAASRLETRRYAGYLGATLEMRKEEGITYNPHAHKIYVAIADIARGMLNNASQDKGGNNDVQLASANQCGGVYQMALGRNDVLDSDYVIGAANGLISGAPVDGGCDIDNIAGPDNVAYIGYNTLIITEDTSDHENNFVWSLNLNSKQLTRILSAPKGAENTGPYMFSGIGGFSYLSNVVQHPNGEAAEPSEGNEAEVGYFGPFPAAE